MTRDYLSLEPVRIWDPIVRLTHWMIAAGVVLNGLLVEEGSGLHVWIGYTVFAVLGLRLLWGLIGPEEARFTAFPPNPLAALTHIKALLAGKHPHYRSHNPLGTLMVYALWGTLLVVCATGIAMEPSPFGSEAGTNLITSAFADEGSDHDREHGGDDEDHNEVIEEIHEFAANLLLLLAAGHLAGVAFETRLSGPGLVRAMVRGRSHPRNRHGERYGGSPSR